MANWLVDLRSLRLVPYAASAYCFRKIWACEPK
uniref:Uncharacterized protein n=1 Tax=Rhizophora mucronata TaxID=61149 RepID=A0A2P2N3M8_RHIMU